MQAHCRAVILGSYWTETERLASVLSPNVSAVLSQLAELYLVYWAIEKAGDLLLVRQFYYSIENIDFYMSSTCGANRNRTIPFVGLAMPVYEMFLKLSLEDLGSKRRGKMKFHILIVISINLYRVNKHITMKKK